MNSLKQNGARTTENLLKAFAGESQARNRYTFYASQAKKEGYIQISNIFFETADNEKEHAERFFNFLCKDYIGETLTISAGYPVGFASTMENLAFAQAGEHEEWSLLYPSFAEIASEEGFEEVAACFREIATVEKLHEARFKTLYAHIKNDSVFQRDASTEWKCNNCGYVHSGKSAPQECPSCLHTQAYFEVYCKLI